MPVSKETRGVQHRHSSCTDVQATSALVSLPRHTYPATTDWVADSLYRPPARALECSRRRQPTVYLPFVVFLSETASLTVVRKTGTADIRCYAFAAPLHLCFTGVSSFCLHFTSSESESAFLLSTMLCLAREQRRSWSCPVGFTEHDDVSHGCRRLNLACGIGYV